MVSHLFTDLFGDLDTFLPGDLLALLQRHGPAALDGHGLAPLDVDGMALLNVVADFNGDLVALVLRDVLAEVVLLLTSLEQFLEQLA